MPLSRKRILWPLAASLAGVFFLTAVYLGLVSLAEGPKHAVELFWQDRWIVMPILLGFGVQAALFTILKKRLFVPVETTLHSGKLMSTSGATSTVAMVACCIHHVTDALPVLGLTTAATFLAQYRIPFMLVGLGTTLFGIAFMSLILLRARRKVMQTLTLEAI